MNISPAGVFQLFINRSDELNQLGEFAFDNAEPGFRLVTGPPDCGLTSAIRQAINKREKAIHIISVDLRDQQPDSLLFQTIQNVVQQGEKSIKEVLFPVLQPKRKEFIRKALGSAVEGVPFAGKFIREVSEMVLDFDNPKDDYREYNQRINEIYKNLVNNKETILVADHIQSAQTHHTSQLSNLINSIPELSIVGLQNSKNQGLCKPIVTSPVVLSRMTGINKFPAPTVELADKILAHLSSKTNRQLNYKLRFNINQGLYYFLNSIFANLNGLESDDGNIDSLQKDLICLMYLSGMPLPISVLLECLASAGLFYGDMNLFVVKVDELIAMGLLVGSEAISREKFIHNSRQGDEIAQKEFSTFSDHLHYSNILYRGLGKMIESERINERSCAMIMLRLSYLVDVNHQNRWRISALKACITSSNFVEATEILHYFESKIPNQTDEDVLTLISACITLKKYSKALDYCKSLNRKSFKIDILRSILEYRTLDFKKAHQEMETLLRLMPDDNDKCILWTYFTALCIDLNVAHTLKKSIFAKRVRFKNSKSYGYLLNIIAAAKSPGRAVKLCQESLKYFESAQDRFGLGGALANLGVHQIRQGKLDESIASSTKGFELLSSFGIQHVHLVLNNLALANILKGNLQVAEPNLRKSLELLQTPTIRVNALTNLAAIGFVKNNPDQIISALSRATEQAMKLPISRVVDRFAYNASLLGGHIQGLPDWVQEFYKARGHEKIFTKERLWQAAMTESSAAKFLRQNYSLPTNQYWYPNPMDLFSSKELSVEASIKYS